jgi:6-phosphogluconolactonase
MTVKIEVVENPASACAALLVDAAYGGGHVVLAGGSTPRAAYAEFADTVRETELDVSGMTLWFGDERCVPPDDERSNFLMVKQSLLDPLGEDAPVVHRIEGELGCEEAAEQYESELRAAGPPALDLALLGVGPDGHTASLFPDQPEVSERTRLVIGVPEPGIEPLVPRVTFTVPALTSAWRVVFLAAGASKADAVAAVFGPNAEAGPHVPAALVAELAPTVTVLLDPAAAAKL